MATVIAWTRLPKRPRANGHAHHADAHHTLRPTATVAADEVALPTIAIRAQES